MRPDEPADLRLSQDQVLTLFHYIAQLQQSACLDPLTSLLNRRGLVAQFEQWAGRCDQDGATLAVVMLDVVGLKQLNARGYEVGDDALKAVAEGLNQAVGDGEVCGRWGGDEFVALLPHSDLPEVEAFLDRLRTLLDKERTSPGITAGWAIRSPGEGQTITEWAGLAARNMQASRRA